MQVKPNNKYLVMVKKQGQKKVKKYPLYIFHRLLFFRQEFSPTQTTILSIPLH